jgi:hypothetical protein
VEMLSPTLSGTGAGTSSGQRGQLRQAGDIGALDRF